MDRRGFGKMATMVIPGLGRVVRPRQQYTPPQQFVAPGSSTGVFLGRLVIVFGTAAGLFVYNGTPALGNPPIFWATSASTDPYGNPIPSTAGIGGTGTFQAGDTIITHSGMFVYNGTPALGNLIVSIASAGGTDGFGNVYYGPGAATYVTSGGQTVAITSGTSSAGGAGFFFSNVTTPLTGDPGIVANVFAPATQGSELFITSGKSTAAATAALLSVLDSVNTGITDGVILLQSGSNQLQGNANTIFPVNSLGAGGSTWGIGGGLSDQTHITITQAAFTVCTLQWGLGNDPRAGTVYRLTTWGLGTWGSTQQALNFRGNITGGSGLGQINFGAGLLPVSTAFNWKVIQEIQILTTGSSGTWAASLTAFVTVGAGNILPGTAANNSAAGTRMGSGSVNTTTWELWIEADWGSTTGAPTLTSQGSILERIGS
jgi:hypothetical protein